MNATTGGETPFVHAGIAFGCDYNPEQWSPEVWREDVELMRQAGVDLVAVNIFGWSQLQRGPGEFDFADLDTVIELLHGAGIRINLGTGTASAPPWLSHAHPEILPVVADGTTRYPGGRQAWCPSSPVFREHALALVDAVAERYGSHPAIALWHVSNELGCHNALCYDEASAAAFRSWLQRRYITIDALNAAWGTSFWSQRYGDWAEILPPLLTLSSRNPMQTIDFHRFSSDELLDYYRGEVTAIRRHSSVPVTTNFMVTAHIRNLDYWSWAPEMDVIANDHYLDHRLGEPVTELSFAADLTRGLSGGAPWLLMESATSAVNWQPYNIAKEPGEFTRNSLSHVARGADGICFFQWRASVQGSEKFHSAMLPHAGTDSAVWREVVELGSILNRLGEVAGSRVVADVALVFSWESWWAFDGESRPSQGVDYLQQVHASYGALRDLGLTVDIVAPGASLEGYRLVVVPALYMVSDAQATVVNEHIAQGGHALVTFFSGIADEDDRVRLGGYPGAFRDALGVRVEEFVPLPPEVRVTLDSGESARLWGERLSTTTASVVSRFSEGALAGIPAFTRNEHGAGVAWYLATVLEADALRELFGRVASEAGVVPFSDAAGHDVEVVRRVAEGRSYAFVINHSHSAIEVQVSGRELITGADAVGSVTVPAGAVRVVRQESAS
ncbi:beta-galactosidase [Homoserinimonas aerilata]|uniref:Beta-galactosidase n=1 Tax=Homoserinimonas aerilata TaxID=1162970 RepID=A0A542YKI1_9MICO|nr:beta-galactosidase [Homoserinimonas aerilata]TQL48444.1 beta-galactosidase [Homoserinimonas aerilata]